jgi:four helix bundle protein
MENIRSFRELKVWQKAMSVALRVFEVTKSFSVEERYSLVDQVRRSSRSVPANIAEAWRKHRHPAAFVSKLNDAEGEAAETQTHLEIALRCRYLQELAYKELDDDSEQVLAMLVTMASQPEKWVVRK